MPSGQLPPAEQCRARTNRARGHRRSHGESTLDVTVDGVEGAALGVMSQGELHALALSLFLPRATLPESPFRFVVIDDPVQSMDPAQASTASLACSRVPRRPPGRRLHPRRPAAGGIRQARHRRHRVEVSRRRELGRGASTRALPVERYLEDARALVRTSDLPEEVGRRVVPGFCRLALEAACIEALRGVGGSLAETRTLTSSAARVDEPADRIRGACALLTTGIEAVTCFRESRRHSADGRPTRSRHRTGAFMIPWRPISATLSVTSESGATTRGVGMSTSPPEQLVALTPATPRSHRSGCRWSSAAGDCVPRSDRRSRSRLRESLVSRAWRGALFRSGTASVPSGVHLDRIRRSRRRYYGRRFRRA